MVLSPAHTFFLRSRQILHFLPSTRSQKHSLTQQTLHCTGKLSCMHLALERLALTLIWLPSSYHSRFLFFYLYSRRNQNIKNGTPWFCQFCRRRGCLPKGWIPRSHQVQVCSLLQDVLCMLQLRRVVSDDVGVGRICARRVMKRGTLSADDT